MNAKRVLMCVVILAVVALAILWYPLRLDRFGFLVRAQIDYVDAVKVDNQLYYSWDFPREEVDAEDVGEKIGSVKYRESENVSNPYYRMRDWDAAFLEVGTEIYRIKDDRNSVAALVDGKYYRFSLRLDG